MGQCIGARSTVIKKISNLLLASWIFFFAAVADASIRDVIQTTCHVNRATGVVFSQDEENYLILTAAHVIVDKDGNEEPVTVQFSHTGRLSPVINGTLVWKEYVKQTTTDLAVVKVAKKDLGRYPPPKIIPLDRNARIRLGDVVVTCGCPHSQWPTALIGHVKSTSADKFKIVPQLLPGRSGSGVFDEKGEKLLGIVIWQSGTAVHLRKIFTLMAKH